MRHQPCWCPTIVLPSPVGAVYAAVPFISLRPHTAAVTELWSGTVGRVERGLCAHPCLQTCNVTQHLCVPAHSTPFSSARQPIPPLQKVLASPLDDAPKDTIPTETQSHERTAAPTSVGLMNCLSLQSLFLLRICVPIRSPIPFAPTDLKLPHLSQRKQKLRTGILQQMLGHEHLFIFFSCEYDIICNVRITEDVHDWGQTQTIQTWVLKLGAAGNEQSKPCRPIPPSFSCGYSLV